MAELNPGLLEAARKAYRASPKTGKPTLRLVAQRLFELGYTTSKGKPLSASMIKRLLD